MQIMRVERNLTSSQNVIKVPNVGSNKQTSIDKSTVRQIIKKKK